MPYLAIVIHVSDAVLGLGKALFGGQPIPPHRLGVVPGHALAIVIHVSDAVLGHCIPLLGKRKQFLESHLEVIEPVGKHTLIEPRPDWRDEEDQDQSCDDDTFQSSVSPDQATVYATAGRVGRDLPTHPGLAN